MKAVTFLKKLPAIIILITSVLLVDNVDAVGEEIVVRSQGVVSQFPDGIIFTISVESRSMIEDIRIFYKSELTSTTSYGRVEFEASRSVEGSFFLNTGGGTGFIPAGSKFLYYYEVRDKSGNVRRTDEKEFVYLDPRFEWELLSDGLLTVYYYGPTQKRAKTILQAGQEAVVKMSRVLGVSDVDPISIIAYNNYRHMSVALPPRAQAVREDLVTQGQAFTEIRVVLVLAYDPDISGITSHEITHVLIDDSAGRGYGVLPIWLNEGLAEFGNISPSESYDNALLYGIYTRRVKPLWHLQSFSGAPDDVVIGYGQSRSVVSYLINVYGEEKMAQFMKNLGKTLSVDDALVEIYGFDQRGLDSEWRDWIGLRSIDIEGLEKSLAQTPDVGSSVKGLDDVEDLEDEASVDEAKISDKEGNERGTSPGCNRAGGTTGSTAIDVSFLTLLAGTVAMLGVRRFKSFR